MTELRVDQDGRTGVDQLDRTEQTRKLSQVDQLARTTGGLDTPSCDKKRQFNRLISRGRSEMPRKSLFL